MELIVAGGLHKSYRCEQLALSNLLGDYLGVAYLFLLREVGYGLLEMSILGQELVYSHRP